MSTKRRSEYRKKLDSLQTKVNLYVRLRDCFGDEGAGCISCGKWTLFEEGDAGHFIATTSAAIRFDERNIHFQCRRCNRFKHGNLHRYYPAMVRKYGQEVVDELMEQEGVIKKWTDDEINALKEHYNERIKQIKSGRLPETPGGARLSMSDLF